MQFSKRRSRKNGKVVAFYPFFMKLIIFFLLLGVLYLCWNTQYFDNHKSNTKIPSTKEEIDYMFSYLSVSANDEDTNMDDCIKVNLDEQSEDLVINKGGKYQLSGSMEHALIVDAEEELVHLFFDNVSIKVVNESAIKIENATKTIITLMEDSKNTISDSGKYKNQVDYSACINSACDLTLNGSGELNVYSFFKDGIRSKDVIRILGGTYHIEAKRAGIYGNDGIMITAGDIFVGTEKYGLKTTKVGDDGRGDLVVAGANLSVIAGRYAFVVKKANLYIFNSVLECKSVVGDFDVKGLKIVDDRCFQ